MQRVGVGECCLSFVSLGHTSTPTSTPRQRGIETLRGRVLGGEGNSIYWAMWFLGEVITTAGIDGPVILNSW